MEAEIKLAANVILQEINNYSKHFDVIKQLNEYKEKNSEVTVTVSREDYIKVRDIVTALETK